MNQTYSSDIFEVEGKTILVIEINPLHMANVLFPKIPMVYLDILVLATIIIKIIFSYSLKIKFKELSNGNEKNT